MLTKIGGNAYVLDLLKNVGFNPIFNMADLHPYHSPLPLDSDMVTPDLSDDMPPPYSLEENSSHPRRIDGATFPTPKNFPGGHG